MTMREAITWPVNMSDQTFRARSDNAKSKRVEEFEGEVEELDDADSVAIILPVVLDMRAEVFLVESSNSKGDAGMGSPYAAQALCIITSVSLGLTSGTKVLNAHHVPGPEIESPHPHSHVWQKAEPHESHGDAA